MHNVQHDHNAPRPKPADDVLAEARVLRRKLKFWRRVAWLSVGIVVLVLVLAWQRTTIRRRECYQALDQFAKQARELSLSQTPAEVLESQWQQFGRSTTNIPSSHYALIVQNWLQSPGEDESLPLAVCEQSHPGVLNRGRHVLFRDRDHMYIVWMTEDEAAPIVAEACKNDH